MSEPRSVRGTVLRGGDGEFYFLPEDVVRKYRVEGDAANQLRDWIASEDVSAHGTPSGGLEFISKIEFEGGAEDDDMSAFNKAFDPLVGTRSYIRRCLNVIPEDLLEIIEQLEQGR